MFRFLSIWLAQTVSVLGSQLSGFAIGVWLFQETGGVTMSALAAAATWLPQVLGAPLAGVITDRIDRRLVLLMGHLGAGLCSLVLLALVFVQGRVAAQVALGLLALSSAFRAVEMPALLASMTMLVKPEQLGRANGIAQLGTAIPQLVAPALAGVMLPRFGLVTVLAVDVSTFATAVVVLLCLRIPRPAHSADRGARSVLDDLRLGLAFVAARPGLCVLLAFFAILNFNLGMAQVAITPLVLGFGDATALGNTLSIGGVGMLMGALLMVAWGGPRARIYGVLGSTLFQGLVLLLAGARASLALVAAGAFGILFAVPISAACTQTIWQRKVPAELQGRVFSLRMLCVGIALPIAQLAAGPLLDRLCEPAMRTGGALAPSLGPLIGVGPGRGAALLLIALGLLTIATALLGFAYPRLLRVEHEVPEAVG